METQTLTPELTLTTTEFDIERILLGLFDEEAYLEHNPDLEPFIEAGTFTALEHFQAFGRFEGREFSRIFNITEYLEKNSDVEESFGRQGCLEHFLNFGIAEGREFSNFFSLRQYLSLNSDLNVIFQDDFVAAFEHFLTFGQFETRAFSTFFSSATYLEFNADLVEFHNADNGFSTYQHFIQFGQFESRNFSSFFNVTEYLNLNSDLIPFVEAGVISPVEHFLQFGLFENREFSFSFKVSNVLEVLEISTLGELNISELITSILENLELILDREEENAEPPEEDSNNDNSDDDSDQDDDDGDDDSDDSDDSDDNDDSDQDDDEDDEDDDEDDDVEDSSGGSDTPTNPPTSSPNNPPSNPPNNPPTPDDSDDDSNDDVAGDDGDDDVVGDDEDDEVDSGDDGDDSGNDSEDDDQDSDDGTGDDSDVESTEKIFISTEFIRVTYQAELEAEFGVTVNLISDDEILNFLDERGLELNLNSSAFVDLEYYLEQYSAALTSFYQVTSVTELSYQQIVVYIQGEGLQQGFSPSPLIDFNYYKQVYAVELEAFFETSVAQVSNVQLLQFINRVGLEEGQNPSPFLHLEYTKQLHLEQIQAAFDIEGTEDLTDGQVIESIEADVKIDLEYVRFKYIVQLEAFYGVEVSEITGVEVQTFAANLLEEGLPTAPIDFETVREQFAVELKQFFKLEDVSDLTDGQIKSFLFGKEVRLDLLTQVVDIEYFKSVYSEELVAEFGADFTDENVIQFAFRSEISIDIDVLLAAGGVDISGYREQYEEEIAEFYSEDEASEDDQDEEASDDDEDSEEDDSDSGDDGDDDDEDDEDDDDGDDDDEDDEDDDEDDDDGDDDDEDDDDEDDDEDDDDEDDDEGTGSVDNPDDENDDAEPGEITDKQVLKFMFREGWKQGMNPLEFADVEFLKVEFQAELSKHFSIELEAVTDLEDILVVDYLYDGFVSEEIDYEFYRQTYAAELEANFGVEVSSLTEVQILEHAYTVGLAQNFELSPIDYDGFLADFSDQVTEYFEIDAAEIHHLDQTQLKLFILEVASELEIDVTQYVDLDYYRSETTNTVIENYRLEQVYTIDFEQTFEFSTTNLEISTSPLVDLEWYRTEYADDLATNQATIDTDGNGEISNAELYDALTGTLLEQGNETSSLYDFEEYFTSEEAQTDAVTYYNAESFEELTQVQKLTYMFGQGLLDGYDPLSQEFLAENPELEFETFLQVNAEAMVEFSGVTSINQVTFTNVYDYQAAQGLLNPTDDGMM